MGLFSGFSLGNLFSGKNLGLENMIGNSLNNLTGVTDQMNKSYQQQLQSMKYQNDYNTKMWNLQNQYNTPVAQLARMREAGIDINPTSYALGTGNLSNTATFVGSENGFSGSGSPAGNPISMALGVANGIAGIRNTNANTRNLDVQNANIAQQVTATKIENDIRRHNLKYAQDHGLPVGNSPTWDSGLGSALNYFGAKAGKYLGKQIDIGPDKGPNFSGLFGKILRAYKKSS